MKTNTALYLISALALIPGAPTWAATITGEITDAATKTPLPARIYITNSIGESFFANPLSKEGSAVRYDKSFLQNDRLSERHTTLSAHPFTLKLKPGNYTFTVERGKEYIPLITKVEVGSSPQKLDLPLVRWVNMAERGWYSGDTHNHRVPSELSNIMLAEDLNVGLPMSHWTQIDNVAPSEATKFIKSDAALIRIDPSHVIWTRNTEYEIFTTAKRKHTLGALLILNHRNVFDLPALPITRIAEQARAEGGLLDMDKHNWPWSLALVPLIKPDLFELTNNHLWRIEFSAKGWGDPAPLFMKVGNGLDSERDWLLYGFQTYYALLNCGFFMSPSAGNASGVHPVPLGHGRVYVHTGKKFDYDDWMSGLKAGRSFVTNGPMLITKLNAQLPGHRFTGDAGSWTVSGSVLSTQKVSSIEIIINGDVVRNVTLKPEQKADGSWESHFSEALSISSSSWVIVRCFEPRADRLGFAHTAPWYVNIPAAPLRAKKQELEWIIQNVRNEMERSAALIPPEAAMEYKQSLTHYEALMQTAR